MTQLFNLNSGTEITSLDGAYGLYIVTVDGGGNPVQSGYVTLATLKNFINTDPSVVPSSNPWRGCQVSLSANQSIPNSAFTVVNFGAEDIDTDSIWNIGAPSRLTVPVGVSKIRLSAGVSWSGNSTGLRYLEFYKNGGGVPPAGSVAQGIPANTNYNAVNCTGGVMSVSAGDYFELRVLQNSGGSLNVLNNSRTWFQMEIIEATV